MDNPTSCVLKGNCLMAVCLAFYFICWLFLFRPVSMPPLFGLGKIGTQVTGWIFCVMTYLSGTAGLILMLKGLTSETEFAVPGIPLSHMAGYAILTYIVCLILSAVFMKRTPTVELLLLTGWTLFEASIIDFLYMTGIFPLTKVLCFTVMTGIAFFVGFISYIKYYNLPDKEAYICGCIPLVAGEVVTIIVSMMSG